jgi:phage tail-like protein
MADAKAAETPKKEGEGAAAAPGARFDPFRAYNFKLLIDGVNEGHFTQCSGLEVRVNPLRYREGGEAQIVHQLAGPVEYAEVTLRYGLTTSPELWAWFQKSVTGAPEPKNVSVVMLGPGGIGEKLRWNLNAAWPCAWRGAPLDALGREIAIESLTLVFESVNRA